ncbi:bacillithiol biosynthesis cysteine-adding enzyme BshC [Niabella aquatica]
MNFKATGIPYAQTHFFSGLVLDYLGERDALRPFYQYFPEKAFLEDCMKEKAIQPINRNLLVNTLFDQYKNLDKHETLIAHLELLKIDTTYTITTAHQPNIFTGPLYFIYKILHAVKLAAYCREQFPGYNFVPVYYMGSEDADLDELGHIWLNREKLTWQTTQAGAVGRMKVDDSLLQLIQRISSEIGVLPHGEAIMALVKKFYTRGESVQNATLGFVNELFGKYGLVVVIPDNAALKSVAVDLFKDELLHQNASRVVEETTQQLTEAGYKVQAHGRNINLFYLKEDGARLRIEKKAEQWHVVGSNISFNEEELIQELHSHPERFSPNVILRGLFQEMILPNIAFIGGGGELAYWLELKGIFNHYKVPYPMLVLRNSFLVIDKKQGERLAKLGFVAQDVFKNKLQLQAEWVKRNSDNNVQVNDSLSILGSLFDKLSEQAVSIDSSLKGHIYALRKQSEKKVVEVGKKLMRAEKRNHADAMRQIEALKEQLFPNNNLQERIDNILPYYAAWGPSFIDALYQHSYALEQAFVIAEEV